MIGRGTVWRLGFGQLISWGVTYYLIGVLGPRMAADLGWSLVAVQGGFAAALLVMGLTSPLVGAMIDRSGGARVMTAGALVGMAGCVGLGLSHGAPAYYAAWLVIGVAMRMTLYDAAFAALARIGGAEARRDMAQITLLGGFASTAFWPIGDVLADAFGWRGAAFAFGACSGLTALLYRGLPQARFTSATEAGAPEPAPPVHLDPRRRALAGGLYALAAALVSALNSAMSAHMIGLLAGLGLGLSTAVWTSALRGFGQTAARGCEVLWGGSFRAVDLNLVAAALLPLGFCAALWSGSSLTAAIGFVLLFGAGNGLSTITRGTLPLALFEPQTYGALVGRLIVPSFVASAAAPVGYAAVIERYGAEAAVWLSIALAAATLATALGLKALSARP